MIEGGSKVINSFKSQDLIDEIHIYTSNTYLKTGILHSPEIEFDLWDTTNVKIIGNDKRKILKRKKKCLQVS